MDNDIAIRVEGLGKKYSIGHQSTDRSTTLRDTIVRAASNFARSSRAMLSGQQIIAGDEIEDFWALKDVSFDIKRGDVVGIIGRNGAGKSTLLKILSRITEPSEGKVSINGRVASLLEVGTGFHPELSGRENIFLNGAILGMGRAEIRRKFDEIVAFAEVEKFLDTPVKRYSSGMYVRLAFAVAAHLEPEILIVDEVLAVGDAEFQKKCLGKMQDVAGEGRTVLFVSHNVAALASLTRTSFMLKAGRLVDAGPTAEVLHTYLRAEGPGKLTFRAKKLAGDHPQIALVELVTPDGANTVETGSTVTIRFGIHFPQPKKNPCLSFQIRNYQDSPVAHMFLYAPDFPDCPPGMTMIECTIQQLKLNVGDHHLSAILSGLPGDAQWDVVERICPFTVVRTDSNPYWGWRPDVCSYFEDGSWSFAQQQAMPDAVVRPGPISVDG